MVLHDLRHRAAHVEVNEVEAFFQGLGLLRDDAGIRTEKLDAQGVLFFGRFKKHLGIFVPVMKRLGRDHFRIEHACALLTAERAEGKVRHAGHGA